MGKEHFVKSGVQPLASCRDLGAKRITNRTKSMNTNILKSFLITAALSLGVAANAQTADAAPSLTSDGQGLLGQTYAGLTYSYLDLRGVSYHADNYGFNYNQALHAGLDGFLSYNYAQTGRIAGSRVNGQDVGAGLRAFSNSFAWGKPFVEASAGYTWTKYAGIKDNSFYWSAAVGAEFQVAPALSVVPFVSYADAPDLSSDGTWEYGVRANYWVNSEWSVVAGVARDDSKNMAFTLGTNFRF